ncbi:MAG TPA: TolC family protein [Candidatus Latescibacteria bacterium]|nr:TolC family protein [Candidatus Latescibacterota bacterium]
MSSLKPNRIISGLASVMFLTSLGLAQQKLELTLEESINIALKKNKSLTVAEEKVKESQAKIGEARAGFFPQINSRSSYTRLDVVPYISISKFPFPVGPPAGTPTRIEVGDDDNYSATVSVQQPIFTGFKIFNSYRIAEYNARAEQFNYEKTKSELIFKVKQSYYDVLKAQEFRKVSEQAVAQMEAHVRDLENMYQVGMVAENDLLKAKVQLSNARLMRIKAVNAMKMAKAGFCSILGLPLDTDIGLMAKLEYEPREPIELDEAIEKALRERPEIKAMQYNINIGQKAVSLAKAQWLPNLMLIGNYNYKRPNREYEKKWYRSWDVTLAVQMNIFDWGTTYYQTAQAKHRLRQIEEGYRQLQDGITLEVTQSYLALQEAQEKVAVARENTSQAEENFRVTHERFKQGMATNTDLLDANTMLTQAKMEYIQALADYNVARAKLERAMGILH